MRMPTVGTLVMVITALFLVTWNGSRFIGAKPQVRTKDLDFLPAPEVALAFSLGHRNTLAKLRWIDSFAYFELQLERKDDTITTTGDSAFERLYRMLLRLDPHFVPFYEAAYLNLGGVLERHDKVMPMLTEGLLTLPHETKLWRMIATEFTQTYKAEERNPKSLDHLLMGWQEAELTPEGKVLVWDWQKAMAQRKYKDLSQLSYWENLLTLTKPGTPSYAYIVNTIREQLARYAVDRLNDLLTNWHKDHTVPPITLGELLEPVLIRQTFPDGIPPYAPVYLEHGIPRLRCDPFGYPYLLVDGHPISPGWTNLRSLKRSAKMTKQLEVIATKTGTWPTSLEEAINQGLELDALPGSCRWQLEGKSITVASDPPPFPAWSPGK